MSMDDEEDLFSEIMTGAKTKAESGDVNWLRKSE